MKKIVQVVQLDTLIDILVMTSSHYDKNKLWCVASTEGNMEVHN